MTDTGARQFISLAVILLAGVFGFVALVTARVESSVERRHTAIGALADISRGAPAADQVLSFQSKSDALKAWIQHGNAVEDSRLYAMLLSLGDREKLRIERIDPTSRSVGQSQFATTTGFAIEAVGAYENVARFLAAIESEFGFANVMSFSLMPIDGEQGESVRVSLETAHLRFDPAALAHAAPGGDEEVE